MVEMHEDIVMDIGFQTSNNEGSDTLLITVAQDGSLALFSINELKKIYTLELKGFLQ